MSKTISEAGIKSGDIKYISAHGTGTIYNDEMESIAFNRLGINEVPLNSLKGYYGHTLGAAGVLETCVSVQALRSNEVLKSMGYNQAGTSEKLNVLTENVSGNIELVLKTSSGFGGSNASLILAKS